MPIQLWQAPLSTLNQHAVAGTPLVSSAAATDVSAAPQSAIPGGYLVPGNVFRTTAFGVFSNTGTPTLNIGVYYGGVAGQALATSGAITTTTGATNWPWQIEILTFIRTTGSSGTAMSRGWLSLPTSLTAQSFLPCPATALATVTINTTTTNNLTCGATWGTSSASNTLTCHAFAIEQIA